MVRIAGVDLGAGATKTVIIDGNGYVLGRGWARTQADFDAVARRSIAAACEEARMKAEQIDYIAATGLGRYSLSIRDVQVTDLTCGARGAHVLCPEARFVLDMGAQSTRAIALRDGGKVGTFRTNEKCAAGSGGFLERVCRYLEIRLEDIGRMSLEATDPQPISSVCAVLAESEIINHISEGRSVPDILRGTHESLASRALSQLKMIGYEGSGVPCGEAADAHTTMGPRGQMAPQGSSRHAVAPCRGAATSVPLLTPRDGYRSDSGGRNAVVFIGGVALQEGMVEACRARFNGEVLVPDEPAHVTSLGAAVLGLQRFQKRQSAAAERLASDAGTCPIL